MDMPVEQNAPAKSKEQEELERSMEIEFEKTVEEKTEEWAENLDKEIEEKIERSFGKYAEPVAGVIFGLIFLILVNTLWDQFDFITEDFADILPIYNMVIGVGIVINFLRIFIHSKAFKVLGEVINAILMVYIAQIFWNEYPFDVDGIWDLVVRGFIIVPTVLVVFGAFISVVKLLLKGEEK